MRSISASSAPGDLQPDRRPDPGRQHVDAALDRHRPGVRQARQPQRVVHLLDELLLARCGRAVIQRNAGFSHSGAQPEYHVSTRRHSDFGLSVTTVSSIESGAGSVEVPARPALPEHALHLREGLDDPVRHLQQPPGLGDRDARHRGGHVEERALLERRHELRAEREEDGYGGDDQQERRRRSPATCSAATRRPPARRRASGSRLTGWRLLLPHPADENGVGDAAEPARDGRRSPARRVSSIRSAGSSVIASTAATSMASVLV